jgi:hypothetical protein
MDDEAYYAKKNSLFLNSKAAALADSIGDYCEDYGSTNRTLDGIADPEARADCAKQIQREKRDHERSIQDHIAQQNLHREKVRANKRERTPSDGERPKTKTFPMGAEIMRRFNRKITG